MTDDYIMEDASEVIANEVHENEHGMFLTEGGFCSDLRGDLREMMDFPDTDRTEEGLRERYGNPAVNKVMAELADVYIEKAMFLRGRINGKDASAN